MFEHVPDATTDDLSSYIRAAREGNEVAFRALYRAIQPGLLRYLRILVGTDAEDVASETWLHVIRDLRTFKGDSRGFRRWVATIGRHRALDHLRYQQRRPASHMPVHDMVELPASDDTEAKALDMMSTDQALTLIAALPQEQAEAIVLRVILGLDAASAAVIMGKRPGAVRTAAFRGLRRLHQTLAAQQILEHGTSEAGGRHATR